ncbi:MAG: cation:proton antiporter [Weeksellaceae bacterium]|nr:cation:proton antiporter [Weeksellaceae bacterium]
MNLFLSLDFSLPLSDNILKFAVILVVILVAPIILNKLKIPALLGLIIAGAFIGPNGFNLIERDSNVQVLGAAGLLYILFLAGLEVDMGDFKKNSKKSLIFGLLTFLIPITAGSLAGHYILNFSWPASILLGSLFASHTLIIYPLISKLGLAKLTAVNVSVGGTVITDTLALLVLAVIVAMTTGEITGMFWVQMIISIIIFGVVVMYGFPIIGRWFLKTFNDSVTQYIFILIMVYLGAVLAEVAGIEGIIGAFLAGLALNRLIPHTSPLMNRIDFVGNALFIPFFLIGVGMLIDYRAFISSSDAIVVAIVMTIIATASKYIAAYLTGRILKFNKDEVLVMFGLSNAQAAATLAAVLVAYNVIIGYSDVNSYVGIRHSSHRIHTNDNVPLSFLTLNRYGYPIIGSEVMIYDEVANGEYVMPDNRIITIDEGVITRIQKPDRLLDSSVLNGSILMILVTCTIASLVGQRGANNLALREMEGQSTGGDEGGVEERILIAINDESHADNLVNLALAIKSKVSQSEIIALNVIDKTDKDEVAEKVSAKILHAASNVATAADTELTELMRYDIVPINAINNVINENHISDVILSLHNQKGFSDSFFGNLTEGLLQNNLVTTIISKFTQPIGTIQNHHVVMPPNAERELGFSKWVIRVWNIARNTGAQIYFYGTSETLAYLKKVNEKHPIESHFTEFSDWQDFLILSREIKANDSLIIILSRKSGVSYSYHMDKIPNYLNKYFKRVTFTIIYPMQTSFAESSRSLTQGDLINSIEKLDEIGKTLASLVKSNK